MDDQYWLEELRRQLIDRNMPRSYVRRFMEEIIDHLTDLKEENMEIDVNARLGESEQIANTAVLAYRHRSFFSRHPVAAFVAFAVSPVLAFLFLWLVGALAFAATVKWLGFFDDSNCPRLGSVGRALLPFLLPFAVNIIPALILSLFYCGLTRRCAVGRKWMVVSSVVLAFIAAMTYCQVTFVGTSGHGYLSIGLGTWSVMQIFWFLTLLAFAWWLSRRFDVRSPQLATS